MSSLARHGVELAAFARAVIEQALGGPIAEPPSGAWTEERAAAFVTLHWASGRLQGCIGNLDPQRGIVDEIAAHAHAAAFRDPRGVRMSLADVDELDVEVSLLSPRVPIEASSEAEALQALVPHRDGVVFTHGGDRATFLPAVWDSLPAPRDFLGALKEKAGYPASFWDDRVRLYRYAVDKSVDAARISARSSA